MQRGHSEAFRRAVMRIVTTVVVTFPLANWAAGRPHFPQSERDKMPHTAGGIAVQPANVQQLLACLVGPGVTVSNVSLIAAPNAAGTFSGGLTALGIETGIVLSSGHINSLVGPNMNNATSTDNQFAGDPHLDALIPGFQTHDAAILQFDFDCAQSTTLSFQYVFASEEYNEFVGSAYNDVFGFFVDGTAVSNNIAIVPANCSNPGLPVAISNVNCENPYNPPNGPNCNCLRNNALDDGGGSIDTEMDGLTPVFSASATLSPGVHTIKIAIADAGDFTLDSSVMLACQSFTCGMAPATGACCVDGECIVTTAAQCEAGCGVFQGTGTACVPDPCPQDCHDGVWAPAEFCGRDAFVVTGETEMNHDCAVDWLDLGLFVQDFGMTGPNLSGDFNGNGSVDANDLAALAGNFGTTATPCTPACIGVDDCRGSIALSFDPNPNNIVSTRSLGSPGFVPVYVVCSDWADARGVQFTIRVTGSASVFGAGEYCFNNTTKEYAQTLWNNGGWPSAPVVVEDFFLNVTATTPVTIELLPFSASPCPGFGERQRWTDSAYNRSIDFASVGNAAINAGAAPPGSATCSVGLNVDLLSPDAAASKALAAAGTPVDGVEWVFDGRHTALGHYDGPFPTYAKSTAGNTTTIRWTGHAVPPNTAVHVGQEMQGNPPLLAIRWLSGNTILGCANVLQAPGTHSFGGSISFSGLPLCSASAAVAGGATLYASNLQVEWHASRVALQDLLGSVPRSPLRTDVVPGILEVEAGGSANVQLPAPPAGALQMVLVYRVADSPSATAYSTIFSEAPVTWDAGTTTGVEASITAPLSAAVWFSRPPRPNPTAGRVEFAVAARTAAQAEVTVVDVAGRLVATLHRGPLVARENAFEWNGLASNGRRQPAGVYLVRVRSDDTQISRKFVLTR